jgi:hypothetical protein
MSDEQERSFDPTRYSPANVSLWQRLPESNARAFAIATALGSFRDGSGSSKKVTSGKQVRGSVVSRERLPAVLEAVGISERQWRRYKAEWCHLYTAHDCPTGIVTLFTQPNLDAPCPGCGEDMEFYEHIPEHHRRARGSERDSSGRFTAKEPAVSRPEAGPNTAIGVDGIRPLTEPDGYARESSSLLGLEVGVSLGTPVVQEGQEAKAVQQTRRDADESEVAT